MPLHVSNHHTNCILVLGMKVFAMALWTAGDDTPSRGLEFVRFVDPQELTRVASY